jgi:glutamate--cysteine ligase
MQIKGKIIRLKFMTPLNNRAYKIGLERELHRITQHYDLSQKNHPLSLGSSYFNPFITTDFAETQVELITTVASSTSQALLEIEDLLLYTQKNLVDEIIYNHSAPLSKFKDQAIVARFEDLQEAHEKRIYRKGLSYRYSKEIQLLTGFHYNFSFENSYIDELGLSSNEIYLNTARNFMRYGWVLLYLFGASPQLPHLKRSFKDACSLRMSKYGYSINVQEDLCISLNSIRQYNEDLKKALNTPYHQYQDTRFIQLNENILQRPSEYYTPIRLKTRNENIDYLEIRCLDINPLMPIGIDLHALDFIKDLLFMLAKKESPPLSYSEMQTLKKNFQSVALHGRNPSTTLTINNETKSVSTFCEETLHEMSYCKAIMNPETLPSKILEPYQSDSDIIGLLKENSAKHSHFYQRDVNAYQLERLDRAKKRSLELLQNARRF